MRRRDIPQTLLASLALCARSSGSARAAAATPDDTASSLAAYDVRQFGADPTGKQDSTGAFNEAFATAARAGHSFVTAGGGGTYRITAALEIDTNRVGFDGRGCILDATAIVRGAAWRPIQSASDVNERPMLNQAHPIGHFTLRGPGKEHAEATAVHLADTRAKSVCAVTFLNAGFEDWGQDVYFSDGAFATQFINCTFGVTVAGSKGGEATTHSVTMSADAVNGGERNTFIGCAWYNKERLIQGLNGNADMTFIGCSFDGMQRAFTVTGGVIYVLGGHIEMFGNTVDIDHCGHVSGPNSSLVLDNVQITIGADKSAYDVFWSDSSVTHGGVFLERCFLGFGPRTISTRLVGGTGRFDVVSPMQNEYADRPTLGEYMNLLAYGDFEDGRYAADWALTDGAARSDDHAHGGRHSLRFSGAASRTPSAAARRSCRPGQYLQGDLWYLAQGLRGSGSTFRVNVAFLDHGGNEMDTVESLALTDDVSKWKRLRFKLVRPAPKGTASAQLRMTLSTAASGAPVAYVDDVIFNLTV
ncbi:MAG TPA: hypothetical protein VGM84_25895 [Steroidobacteraceae bacterium]